MKNNTVIIIALILALGLFGLWAANYYGSNEVEQHNTSALEMAGDECVAIADKSVAHMVAVVEFQKLEIAGRKVRVMRQCMNDHGFYENPAWLKFASPMVQATATKNNISIDEALENLKRIKMLVFIEKDGEPIFWVKGK